MKKLILGSASPRRKDLLQLANLNFEIRVSDVDESFPDHMNVFDVAEFVAKKKSEAIKIISDEVLITCDTVVILENKIYGKPENEMDAKQMLGKLSGHMHSVVSGVCIRGADTEIIFKDITEVYFNQLSEAQIEFYVNHYKPFDKAGSYAIQEWIGAVAIQKINGCYFNVMGLPVNRVVNALKQFDIENIIE